MTPRKNRVEFPPRLTSQSETIFNGLKLLNINNHFAVFFYAETMSFLVELQRVSNLDEFCLHVNDRFDLTGSEAEVLLRDELHNSKTKLEEILNSLIDEYDRFSSDSSGLKNCLTFSLRLYLFFANNSTPPNISSLKYCEHNCPKRKEFIQPHSNTYVQPACSIL